MDLITPSRETVETIALIGGGLIGAAIVFELLALHLGRRDLDWRVARMALLGIGTQAVLGPVLFIFLVPVSAGLGAYLGAQFALFEVGTAWYAWIYGFLVYELWYWLQHWLAHKVRLLWCIHSPHHAPGGIHMAIGANHHFLEGLVYFPLFLGFLPALFGVHPIVVIAVNVADSVWGSFLHLSEAAVARGRYGLLGRFMQTPSYHRVHHAKNARYMDRNFNSITLLWDWILGTLEPLDDDEPIAYGITRPVDDGSFWDVHFGEFVALWRDVRGAKGLFEALGYVFRPPGWRPGDASQTVAAIRQRWISEHRA